MGFGAGPFIEERPHSPQGRLTATKPRGGSRTLALGQAGRAPSWLAMSVSGRFGAAVEPKPNYLYRKSWDGGGTHPTPLATEYAQNTMSRITIRVPMRFPITSGSTLLVPLLSECPRPFGGRKCLAVNAEAAPGDLNCRRHFVRDGECLSLE